MTEKAHYLIAYVWHPGSNAHNILQYAKKRAQDGKISITNLGKE
jgi:hypothetical protein